MTWERALAPEVAERIRDVWPDATSVMDAMHRAGLDITDVRTAYRYRRLAEDVLSIHLPTINPEHLAGDWRLRHGRDVPHAYVSDKPFTIVVFSDAHFWPGHTSPAYWILLQIIDHVRPDIIIDNGDSLDSASISRHAPNMWEQMPTLRQELDCCREHLQGIRDAAVGAYALRHIGNHDMRFEALLAQRAPELAGMPGTKVQDLFGDWDHKVSTIFNEVLFVKHRFRSGMHSAYNNVLHAGMSIVTGHTHKLGIRAHTDMRGTRYGIETGTLADPHGPQFRYVEHNPRDWRMGFAVITVDGKRIHPEIVEVHDDGTAWFRGQLWRA